MTTLYWFPTASDPTSFNEKDNWANAQQTHPAAPPGAGDTIIGFGRGPIETEGAAVANAYLAGEALSGNFTVTGAMAGLGTASNGSYTVGSIRRVAFQSPPWAGGGTNDTLGLTFNSVALDVGAVDLSLGGSVLVTGSSAVDVGTLAIGSGSDSAMRGTFGVQSGGHADIGGAIINNGTLNVGHITLGAGTSVDLNAGVSLLGSGSMQVYAGASAHVTGAVLVDDIAESLPGGLAGGVVARGSGGALTVDGDVTIAATQHGLLRIMQGASATINGAAAGLVLARDAGSQATMDVSSTGTTATVNGVAHLGERGTAALTVSFGGHATFNNGLQLAVGAGSSGSVFVGGSGSALFWSGDFDVGVAGAGALSVSAGGRASGYDFNAGSGSGDLNIRSTGSGSAEVSGAGALLEARNVTIGDATATVDDCGTWTHEGTIGKLTISSGGDVQIASTLTLDNGDLAVGPPPMALVINSGGSLEIGGNSGAASDQLTIGAAGHLTGNGIISVAHILNNGLIEARQGTLTLLGDFSDHSTGTLRIGDGDEAKAELFGAFHGRIEFAAGYETTVRLASERQYETSANGLRFTGTIAGLQDGNTLELEHGSWGALADIAIAHSQIIGSELEVTLSSGQTVTYALEGADPSHTFTVRGLPDGNNSLTYLPSSPQMRTGLSGTPADNTYVDALILGWAAWEPSQGPITYWFADASDVHDAIETHGQTEDVTCDDPQVDSWSDDERAAFERALQVFSSTTGLTFERAASAQDANLVWWLAPGLTSLPGALGSTEPLHAVTSGHLWQVFDHRPWLAEPNQLSFGGDGFNTIIHELGHALGLAHPTDGGFEPDRNAFPNAHDGSTGTNGQNQAVFTVMSYNQGWTGAPIPHNTKGYGTQGGLGAFDIAALQKLYGENGGTRPGDDPYVLPTENAPGTGWSAIWDTGGTDTITNIGSNLAATIDLRAAPLSGVNAGGFVSHAGTIAGGFTIAHGVVIENATGGNGVDTIIGNDAANTLDGRGGNDVIDGGDGTDTAIYSNLRSAYTIFRTATHAIVDGPDGRDTVINVERLSFVDQTIDITDVSDAPAPADITGTPGNDQILAPEGSARIDGLGGIDTVTFDFGLTDATVSYAGTAVVIDTATTHTVLTAIETFVFTDGTVDNNDGNWLVDDLHYYSQNRDVWNAHIEADAHYAVAGWHEGRDPNAFFDTSTYLSANPDVAAAGVDPLKHFDQFGWKEGRAPSPAFNVPAYLSANPDVAAAGVDPLVHFLQFGAGEGREPAHPISASGFDFAYYLQANPDVAAAGVDPLWHFQTVGWHEGRDPNALFDTAGYLAVYTDVAAAGINPLDHYHVIGWQEGRDPSLAFDTASYLAANPDVTAAHIDPLAHYLRSGQAEGRVPFADGLWGQA
jgi:serralysin